MLRHQKRVLWTWIAGTTLVLVIWLSQTEWGAQEMPVNSAIQEQQQPDAVISDVRLSRFNHVGDRNQVLTANVALQFESIQLTTFEEPKVFTLTTDGAEWLARSHQGSLKKQEHLRLYDAVRVDFKPIDPDSDNYYLTTQALDINLIDEIATSEDPSEMFSSYDHVISQGFRLDLKTKKLDLTPNVQGFHQARPQP